MIKDFEIILGKGFDNIKLGMTIPEIEKILGEPGDKEEYKHENGDESKTYYYYKYGFDLTFESIDEFRLSYISADSEEFHLKKEIVVGKTKDEILKCLETLKLSKPEIEEVVDDEIPNHELMSFDEENLNLWFVNGFLDEIQIGPFWKDDDSPVWPE